MKIENEADIDLELFKQACEESGVEIKPGTGKLTIQGKEFDIKEVLNRYFPGWIPTKERLPDESGIYTVFRQELLPHWPDTSCSCPMFYNKGQGLWLDVVDHVAYNAHMENLTGDALYAVTYWMPKPADPKPWKDGERDGS